MAHIATACGRSDLFAFYASPHDTLSLPVVGWNEDGRAIAQKPDGSTVIASRSRPRKGFYFDRIVSRVPGA